MNVRSGRGWVLNSIAPSPPDCDGRAADLTQCENGPASVARGASDQLTMRRRPRSLAACSVNADGSCDQPSSARLPPAILHRRCPCG